MRNGRVARYSCFLLAAALLTGCGEERRAPDALPATAPDVAPLAQRCGLPTTRVATRTVPRALLSPRLLVSTDDGTRAAGAVGEPVAAAYKLLRDAALKAGYAIHAEELETLDAELLLGVGDSELSIALRKAPKCLDASTVTFVKRG